MEKKDIASQAERYKQEMMKLYGLSSVNRSGSKWSDDTESNSEISDVNTVSEPEAAAVVNVVPETDEYPEAPSDPTQVIKTEPEDTSSEIDENTAEEKYPEPDLSELDSDFGESSAIQPEMTSYDSEAQLGDSKGYILVNVRTGDDSEPIENASVMVTAIVGGNRLVLASGATDESGRTALFEVAAPDTSYSQSPDPNIRPYSLYDISVTAEGFFNSRSVDVPVFGGVTSVQTFSMIPIPLFMSPRDETVTYYNQEPNL